MTTTAVEFCVYIKYNNKQYSIFFGRFLLNEIHDCECMSERTLQ